MRTSRDKRGELFGKLTVLFNDDTRSIPGREYVFVKCVCGTIKSTRYDALKSGATVSCGCGKRTHGLKHGGNKIGMRSPEYCSWDAMIQRCTNPNTPSYYRYGGRGISVDPRWNNFEVFLADMGVRPSASHSIDRINNELNYNRENCRWATKTEQSRNTARNVLVEYAGRKQCLAAWAQEFSVEYNLLRRRLRAGWTVEAALKTPKRIKRASD